MQTEGKIEMSESLPSTVPFHVIGPEGAETRQLRVGVDIPQAQYEKLVDPGTGALYGLTVYEKGVPKTTAIPHHVWEQARAKFAEIDREGEESMRKIMGKLENL